MLERPTRRYLIDPMLRALGWNVDNPDQVAEEARSQSEGGDRLHFDYLGLSRQRAPVLILEAKGADAGSARRPRGPVVDGARMADVISDALAALKAGQTSPTVLAEWTAWLADLREYVVSLGSKTRPYLKRVVITSGRWLIVFTDPDAAFVDDGVPDVRTIQCYTSAEEMLNGSRQLYAMLARERLTDTLPLALDLPQALELVDLSDVHEMYRGVVVATRLSGALCAEYPIRAVYPAIVAISGGRAFAIVDYRLAPIEERGEYGAFMSQFEGQADAFERRALERFGRPDLTPCAIEEYPAEVREPAVPEDFAPLPGSTAALSPTAGPVRPQLVRRCDNGGGEREYLVITGKVWYYKARSAFGALCEFHEWAKAKELGVTGTGRRRVVHDVTGFTLSGEARHCEESALFGMRSDRCQVKVLESHMCCRACVFHNVCWKTEELPRLPCPR